MLSAQKLHRPELGEVSYHWAMGKQQGGYRNRLRKVFSRSHHAAFSKKTGSTSGASKKNLAISPSPLPSVKGPCRYAFNASFTRQIVDTPLPAIFAALWIECPPFNKCTMAHNTQMDRNPTPYAFPYAPMGVRL
jgi:hypothetical protein